MNPDDLALRPKKVVLTCAQPSNKLHLGNYLGAIRQWSTLQDSHECYFGIVDLHAMTLPYVPADLRNNSLDCAAQYISCGLDPQKAHIFLQSCIQGVTKLAWILSCLAPLGQLERMTQFKDKAGKQNVSVGSGLLFYPVLQAADILLYNADLVPVGEDQKQHLELTRDLAQKFNNTFSPTFTVPEPFIPSSCARLMALQEPNKKMSKSDPNAQNTLFLFEPVDSIRKKIMSAVTDSDNAVRYVPEKKGISNLIELLAVLTGFSVEKIQDNYQGKGYAEFKKDVADAVIALLEPLHIKYKELISDKEYLKTILREGSQAAQYKVNKILSKVERKVGLLSL